MLFKTSGTKPKTNEFKLFHLRWALYVPTSCFLLKVAVTKLSRGAQYLKIFLRNDTATRNSYTRQKNILWSVLFWQLMKSASYLRRIRKSYPNAIPLETATQETAPLFLSTRTLCLCALSNESRLEHHASRLNRRSSVRTLNFISCRFVNNLALRTSTLDSKCKCYELWLLRLLGWELFFVVSAWGRCKISKTHHLIWTDTVYSVISSSAQSKTAVSTVCGRGSFS